MRPTTIKAIADGAPFDPVEAIRTISQYLVDAGALGAPFAPTNVIPCHPREGGGKAGTPIGEGDEYSTDTTAIPLSLLLGARTAGLLAEAGYTTAKELTAATDQELLAIDGVAEKTLATIRQKLPVS